MPRKKKIRIKRSAFVSIAALKRDQRKELAEFKAGQKRTLEILKEIKRRQNIYRATGEWPKSKDLK